jgi:hypothetical protein
MSTASSRAIRDPDTGKVVGWEDLTSGAADASAAYTAGASESRTRRGRQVTITIPHRLADRLEKEGLDLAVVCRAASLKAVNRLLADPTPGNFFDRTADRQLARHTLGQMIVAARRHAHWSRRSLHAMLKPLVDDAPELNWMDGWSLGSLAAWERGRQAPPSIEPFITLLSPDEPEAWRKLWRQSRRGES